MIELNDVSYSYEGVPALRQISMRIDRGESVSFMGVNGCGKSTLLKLLGGLISQSSGAYTFDGEAITRKKLSDSQFAKSFHQRVGLVFQNSDTQLFCPTVFDEVAFGPRQMGLPETEVRKRVDELLALLRLHGYERRQPYHLSGGEKRKVAVASALAMNPEVLMLDEPMNGLDPKTQRWLAGFLKDLNLAGKTILLSTHDLELVQEISRRSILFGEDHTMAADLPTNTLLDKIDLLKQVNFVDEYYHKHADSGHSHFHIHN
jgi:cobalt/nickel transport system ATP-binding protein